MNNITNTINQHYNLNKCKQDNYPYLNIVTQNIRGLTNKAKQDQIIHFMELNKIHIMGLAETKANTRTLNFNFKEHNDKYFTYFHNKNEHSMGAGIGLIIDKNISKFITKKGSFMGRIIFIDLELKGKNRVRIIQVYIYAKFDNNNKVEINNVYKQINNLIDEAQKKQTKIILMGDFNANPEKYKKDYNRNGQYHWKFNLLHDIETKNLLDMVDLHQNITDSNSF